MSPRPIYLDNAATTAVDPRVIAEMSSCLGVDGDFANPSSVNHVYGRQASARVERARAEVAALVNAAPEQILFTSGATEANNLALLGAARFHRNRSRHIVTSRTEHPAVLDACRQLEREGCAVTYLKPGPSGIVEVEQVAAALRPGHAARVADAREQRNRRDQRHRLDRPPLPRTAACCSTSTPRRARASCRSTYASDAIDLLSLTAHKLHGPKGIGALCVRREPRLGLVPLQFGGGQERGLRSGTLPTHQIVGIGSAYRIARESMSVDIPRIAGLREQLWRALADIPGVELNGDPVRRVAGILNVTVDGVEGEALLLALADLADVIRLRLRQPARRAFLCTAGPRAQRSTGTKLVAVEPRAFHDACRGRAGRVPGSVQKWSGSGRASLAPAPCSTITTTPGTTPRFGAGCTTCRPGVTYPDGPSVAKGRAGDREQGAEVAFASGSSAIG